MFGSIGMYELVIILVIALIIFGPRKLPELGKSLGKSLSEFKRASADLQNTLEQEIRLEEQKEQVKAKPASEPTAASDPFKPASDPFARPDAFHTPTTSDTAPEANPGTRVGDAGGSTVPRSSDV